ncbi:MAG: exo-alpha-sialidase [Planctomycetales bacterium]|nr:exo-alpha-sialidase [Planctomycetales bacterium]
MHLHPLHFFIPLIGCGFLGGIVAPNVSVGQLLTEATVFESGTEGYHTFRIPAILRAADGALLAFAEGRKHNASDTGDIDIVLRRSTDQGLSWGPTLLVADVGPHTIGNPSPILDRATGRIVLLANQNHGEDDQREIQSNTGHGPRTAWVCTSDDHGLTWTLPTEITAQVKHPEWRWFAFGPAHGIQLFRGAYAGRLLVGAAQNGPNSNGAIGVFSDDGGATWNRGVGIEAAASVRPSESVVVELVDGRVYMNCRNRGGHERPRAMATSEDGGETFSHAGLANQLIDPTVQGSLLRLRAVDEGDDRNQILFSNPAHPNARRRLTVRSSFDETETWTPGKLIHRGPSAYSDLVELDDSAAGVLYEHGHDRRYERIRFASWPAGWLQDTVHAQFVFSEQPADGPLRSSRGHPLAAQVEGSPTLVSWNTAGDMRQAWHFDAPGECLRILDDKYQLFDFENDNSFTLEAVFRTTAHSGEKAGAIISKDKGPNTPSYWLRVEEGAVRFFVSDGETAVSVASGQGFSDGNWHHVFAARDTDQWQLRLHVDGKLVDHSADVTHKDLANDSDLLIGAFNNSSHRQFYGDLSLVRIHGAAANPTDLARQE